MHLVYFDVCAGVGVLYLENQDSAILVVSQDETSLVDVVQKELHVTHLEELCHAVGLAGDGVVYGHAVGVIGILRQCLGHYVAVVFVDRGD